MTRCCGTGRPALSTMWAYIRVRNPLAVGAWTRVLPSRVSKPAISSGPYRYVRTPPGSVRTSLDEARDAADAPGAPQKTRSSAVAAVALHLTERHYSSPDRTRNARSRTAPRTKKARRGGPFLHAPKRTRTSTRLSRTRPSTLTAGASPFQFGILEPTIVARQRRVRRMSRARWFSKWFSNARRGASGTRESVPVGLARHRWSEN